MEKQFLYHSHNHSHQKIHFRQNVAQEGTRQHLLAKPFAYPNQSDVKERKYYRVDVVFVNNPSSFFCQFVENAEFFNDLMERVAAVYSDESKESITQPQLDMPCVAKFKVDGRWYRGKIVRVDSLSLVNVLFVDYGNVQSTPISWVKIIDREFLDFPPQAYKCSLDVAVELDLSDWTPKEILRFKEVTMEKRLCAKFTPRSNNPNFTVVLMEHCDDGSTVVINKLFQRNNMRPYQQTFRKGYNAVSAAIPNLTEKASPPGIQHGFSKIKMKPNRNPSTSIQ